jgi:FtsH-binding integral membrane protein
MEFSGQNQAIVDKSQLTESEKKQQAFIDKVKKLKATKWIIFAIVLLVIVMSVVVRDVGPGVGTVTREAFLMAICGALPTIMISMNRDDKHVLKEFVVYFGLFFVGHYTLQLGGFYSNLLPEKSNNISV